MTSCLDICIGLLVLAYATLVVSKALLGTQKLLPPSQLKRSSWRFDVHIICILWGSARDAAPQEEKTEF